MRSNAVKDYLLSVPERVLRSASALAGGLVRELGEATLPARVRRTRLYDTLVDSTLRFLIEQVGQVEDAYPAGGELATDFLARRTAGNVLEAAGIVAFHASPVWVMAALADLTGAGRDLIQEISEALKQEGLLEPDANFETVDQMLDGLERTAGRLAESINTPPLDVAALRKDWDALRREAATLPRWRLPRADSIRRQWRELKDEAAAQRRSIFELSSAMALSAVRRLPDNLRWLSRCARCGARRTGQVFASVLLDHYKNTLQEIRETGYVRYWVREFQPYLAGAARQFSPRRESLTERLLRKRRGAG